MKISLKWIKQFVDLNIVDKKALEKVVVGFVESLKKHPGADALKIAQVNIGDKTVQIVCGGTNLKEKAYVPVALPGAILPGNFVIQTSKIRGEESNGMICAQEELKLGTNPPREIWLLDSSKKWKAGTPLAEALNLQKAYSPDELKTLLTHHTAEIEEIEYQDVHLHKVVTGKLLEFEKIQGSDKLHRGTFDIGWKKVQIVFGMVHKVNIGEILPVALAGAKLPGGEIKNTEFLGTKSEGMVCGDDELGISEKHLTRFATNTPLGKPVAEILGLDDVILVIDNKSLTHRPDLWGHYGIAREIAAITGKKLKPFNVQTVETKSGPQVKVETKDPIIMRRFLTRIISGIKIEPSPRWMQNRLQMLGMRPVNNIVDITNYVMLELGYPLHAFDRRTVANDHFVIRFAKPNEQLTTLDHKIRKLSAEDILVTNGEKALGLAGTMGGLNSEITDDTTEIIMEVGNWNSSLIRKMSQRHSLRTDAATRFEKSLDPEVAFITFHRACQLVLELCKKSRCIGPVTDYYPKKAKPISVLLNVASTQNKIGTPISETEMISHLKALQFDVTKAKKGFLEVMVPTFRATKDISIPDDLVEEIARMHGYDKIEAKLPELPTKLPRENIERKLKHEARDILSLGLGFDEVYNYSFYSVKDIQKALLPLEPHIKVLNRLSEDQTHLRISLLPNLLKNIGQNLKFYDHLKLYEIGRTYIDLQEYFPIEEKKIIAAVVESKKGKNEVFYEAKGALEEFLKQFRAAGIEMRKGTSFRPYAHPNKYATYHLKKNDEEIAAVFELHPLVAKNHELQNVEIGLFEVNFTKLVASDRKTIKYRLLPKFPGITFDVSVMMDRKMEVGKIQQAIGRVNRSLIREVKLFDLYEGPNIGEGKKSLAFKITLRSDDRTLTDEEMKKTQQTIFAELQKLGGEIRGLKA